MRTIYTLLYKPGDFILSPSSPSSPSMHDAAPPPFPDDVATVPLLVIDYALLQVGDEHEIDRLWQAATELGFW